VNLDTVVAVYIGPDISHLIQVGANDDYYPYWRVPNGQNYPQLVQTSETYGSPIDNPNVFQYPLPLSGPSILRFNATAGTTYYIAVDSMIGKGYSQFSTSFSWLSQVGEGLISLNWAFRPSGILRFATEEYDLYGWLYGSILNPTNVSMPPTNAPKPNRSLEEGVTPAMQASTILTTPSTPAACWSR
jgi:hypothetical protein